MAKTIPTVYVHSINDPAYRVRINEADFDPAIHTLWNDAVQQKEEKETSQAAQKQTELIEPETQDARAYREIELMGIYESDGWRGLKAIAEPLGIEKPQDGWDESIPLILEAEGYGPN